MPGPAFDLGKLQSSLRINEGVETFVYDDATGKRCERGDVIKGNLSIGVGRNLMGQGLSSQEITYLLMNNIQECINTLQAQCPWWSNLSDARARAMIELCFNMGWGDGTHGLSTFHEFLSMMASGAFDRAADALADSLWAREVQESRKDALLTQLRDG